MDKVKEFNNELRSLHSAKTPISKASMTKITKLCFRAIKLYKHAVQCVEKFIEKARTDMKLTGLYLIDSIVRQSIHQYGKDKDVFGPRFSKNIFKTFNHILNCPVETRSKIERVLTLWIKNDVLEEKISKQLLDNFNNLQLNNTTVKTEALQESNKLLSSVQQILNEPIKDSKQNLEELKCLQHKLIQQEEFNKSKIDYTGSLNEEIACKMGILANTIFKKSYDDAFRKQPDMSKNISTPPDIHPEVKNPLYFDYGEDSDNEPYESQFPEIKSILINSEIKDNSYVGLDNDVVNQNPGTIYSERKQNMPATEKPKPRNEIKDIVESELWPESRDGRVRLCSITLCLSGIEDSTEDDEIKKLLHPIVQKHVSVNVIPLRKLAYLIFSSRKAAYVALHNRMQSSMEYTLTWSKPKGLKRSNYANLWRQDLGFAYIDPAILPLHPFMVEGSKICENVMASGGEPDLVMEQNDSNDTKNVNIGGSTVQPTPVPSMNSMPPLNFSTPVIPNMGFSTAPPMLPIINRPNGGQIRLNEQPPILPLKLSRIAPTGNCPVNIPPSGLTQERPFMAQGSYFTNTRNRPPPDMNGSSIFPRNFDMLCPIKMNDYNIPETFNRNNSFNAPPMYRNKESSHTTPPEMYSTNSGSPNISRISPGGHSRSPGMHSINTRYGNTTNFDTDRREKRFHPNHNFNNIPNERPHYNPDFYPQQNNKYGRRNNDQNDRHSFTPRNQFRFRNERTPRYPGNSPTQVPFRPRFNSRYRNQRPRY
ncbi:hypothetical protein A3Q56_01844 [Intoshia linei]|uniref:CID domain-containing protein n=1 Tax=Intoshia linei TaxID=1819745 RepID=A0A177B9V9_9BILA|nr:hypothetical protein A3Q56_01844 [Intoshia linei]